MLRSLCTRLALLVFIGAAVFWPTTVSRVTAQSSGPVAAYALSDGSGTTTADASGNGNTGTLQGATAWTSGYFGSGISISGAYSTGVQAPMSSSLASITTAYTLEGWVNLSDISQSQTLVSLGSGSTFQGLYVSWGIVRLRAWLNGTQYQISSPSPIVANQWTHLAATYDGATLHLFVNGVEVANGAASGTVPSSSSPLQIGAAIFQPFTGKIDEVRVYARALSAAEIKLDRQTPVDPSTPFAVGVQSPLDNAVGVLTTPVTAGFSRAIDESTLTTGTFELRDPTNTVVPSSVTYSASAQTATLTPNASLQPLTQYTARVVGGSSGVKDASGNALAGDVTWSFTTAAPPTAPVAAYAFSEGTGTTTSDGAGNGNVGTLQGATSWTAGYFGNGISISGAYGTGALAWKTESLAAISSAYTLEGWVNFADTSQNQSVVSFGSGTTFQSLYVSYGIVRLRAWINGTQYQISSPSPIVANQWTHVAGTYDGSQVHVYINGVEVAHSAASGPVLPSSDPMQIGGAVFQPFTGKIDEVRVYKVALDASAIAEDMITPVDQTTAFQVGVKTPANGALGVRTTPVTAGFTRPADPSTMSTSTFVLYDNLSVPVPATVSYDAAAHRATLTPVSALNPLTQYSAKVVGGASGVKDVNGNALAGDVTWSFTTAASVTAPVAAYALSEGTGTMTADSSGNGNTGTLQGATSWTTGYFGNAISINGAYGTGVQAWQSESLSAISSAYTLEAWVNFSSTSQNQSVVSFGSGTTFQSLYVSYGIVRLRAWINGTQYQISSPSAIAANQWTHLAGTYDGTAVHLFVNGVEVANAAASGPVLPSSDPLQIGAAVFQPFTGTIDEVRVYQVALNASAIAEDMTSPVDQTTAFQVGVTTPANNALGIETTPVTASFTHNINLSTLTSSTFALYDNANVLVPATISYAAATRTATLTPNASLQPLTHYTARVVGGSSGVKDVYGTSLPADVTWSFTTAASSTAPVAAYALSEGTGTTTADSSGNGNTGTLQGATSWTTGYFGNGISINGAYGTGVQVWKSESLAAISSAYTLEGWVNLTDTSQSQSLVSFGSGTTFQSLFVTWGVVSLRAWLNGTQYQVRSPSAILPNQWTHIAATYDGAALHLFVNGVEVANTPASGAVLPSSDPLQIGGAVFQPFTGKIDEVRIYQVALGASSIARDMITPIDQTTAFQVGYKTPADGAVGILTTPITAGFTRPADASTVTTSTFTLVDDIGNPVPATVTYDATAHKATLTPTSALFPLTQYTAKVVSGSGGVKDTNGNALAADVTWSFTTAAPATAPVAAYGLSEGSGTTTADSSGNGNVGTLQGTTAWSAGYFGSGILVSGAYGTGVLIPKSESLAGISGAYTLEAWVNLTDTSQSQSVVSFGSGTTFQSLFVSWGTVYLRTWLSGTQYQLGSPSPIVANQWTHLAASYDGTAMHLFVNGVEVAAAPASGLVLPSADPVQIGAAVFQPFTGYIDEVRIYKVALTATDIAADMALPADVRQAHIVSVTPSIGGIGQSVTLTGVNFGNTQDTTTVTFNGTAALALSWGSTSIGVIVPAAATTGPVVVTKLGVASNAVPFTVVPAPVITSITPNSGPIGQAVTIAGANFGATQGTSTVTFNGVLAAVTSWSATSIAATVPPSSTGPVVVTVAGLPSNAVTFTSCSYFVTRPDRTSAASGQTGWVAVTTSGPYCSVWTPTSDATWLTVGPPDFDTWGTFVSRINADQPIGYWGFHETVGATTAYDYSGHGYTGLLQGGAAVNTLGLLDLDGVSGRVVVPASPAFTMTNALTAELWILTTTQNERAIGAMGDPWELYVGSGGVLELRLLGNVFRGDVVVNDNQWHFVDATWDGQTVALYVDGVLDTQTAFAGVLPASSSGLMIGAHPTRGDYFSGQMQVVSVYDHALTAANAADRFNWENNGAPSDTSGVFAYAIDANPTGDSRTATIRVADQVVIALQLGAPSVITNVSPTSGPDGTTVTVTGTGFGGTQGSTLLWLGNKSGVVVSWNDTQIVGTVATGATSGVVQVRRNDMASNSLPFTVPVPAITSVTPASGPVGTSVTITGSNFGVAAAAGQVWLGTASGAVTSWSDTQIVATVASDSTTGNVQVLQNGTWSNAVVFTVTGLPPQVSLSLPRPAAVGATVNVYGTGFGTSQGTGTVSISGVSAPVTAWTDTQITITVPAGAVTGVLRVQQNGLWSNPITFQVTVGAGGQQITLMPNVLNLLIGQTRTIQALDAQSNPVTGLTWTSSNPTIVALSSADPPVLTALSSGHVVITAGAASADVTVFATDLPEGTVLWSFGGQSTFIQGFSIAVPNYDAVADVFASEQGGRVDALMSDGTVAWSSQQDWNATLVPDFSGGLVVVSGDWQRLFRLDPLTGQPGPTYAASTDEDRSNGLNNTFPPNIHTDGTIFIWHAACHDFCEGNVETEDGAWVTGINPSTGAARFEVPLANDTYTVHAAGTTATFCPSRYSPGTVQYHAWPTPMKIAGDGFAYLAYVRTIYDWTFQRTSAQPYPDWVYDVWDQLVLDVANHLSGAAHDDITTLRTYFNPTNQSEDEFYFLDIWVTTGDWYDAINWVNRQGRIYNQFYRPCDAVETTTQELHFMRVGSDATSSDVVVKRWVSSDTTTYRPSETYIYEVTDFVSGATANIALRDSNIITNRDQGALYSWQVRLSCAPPGTQTDSAAPLHTSTRTDDGCGDGTPENQLTVMTNGAIVSDVTWNIGAAGAPLEPVLQLEDGFFAGWANGALQVFNAQGGIKWSKSGAYPSMATPGAGLIASTASGLYVLDADGSAVGQAPWIPNYSWGKNDYEATDAGIALMVGPNLVWGTSYAAMPAGNPSVVGTALVVVDSTAGYPAYGLSAWGDGCRLDDTLAPPLLIGGQNTTYLAKKQSLFSSASNPLSMMCEKFFTDSERRDWDPRRANFSVQQLKDAVDRQIAYNGSKTTISRFSAGMFAGAAVNDPAALDALRRNLRKMPVCQMFVVGVPVSSLTPNTFPGDSAASQAAGGNVVSKYAPDPPTNMYVNTDSRIFSGFTEGTILHEALHNLTGLIDEDLMTFVGLAPNQRIKDPVTGINRITQKLVDVGCAPR